MAGLDGVDNKIDPGEATSLNLFHLSDEERKKYGIESLPGNLKEALDNLQTDTVIRKRARRPCMPGFLMRLGRAEWDSYRIQVHKWETDRYLNII